jgi:signal transduction histidine kinase
MRSITHQLEAPSPSPLVQRELVWILVSDTGPGIPIDQQEKVFVFSSRRAWEKDQARYGTGLTIARDLVIAHGGKIELESTPGFGSRFTIWIPIFRDATIATIRQDLTG